MKRAYWKEYSAFFRLTERDLRTSLHGWLPPPALLDEPVLFRGINPFTREPLERWTRVPRQPQCGLPDAVRQPDLSHCPWISTETLQPDNMATLTRILFRCSEDAADDHWGRFLAGPEYANDILQPVSSEFVRAVVDLTTPSLNEAASAWQHVTELESVSEGWATRVLARAQAFFGESPNSSYFFWTCR